MGRSRTPRPIGSKSDQWACSPPLPRAQDAAPGNPMGEFPPIKASRSRWRCQMPGMPGRAALRGRRASQPQSGNLAVHRETGKKHEVQVLHREGGATHILAELRGGAGPDDPVFRSRKGGHLDPSAVHRIVKAAANRAELPDHVSAHWLRHAYASHSLDRGAPIHLVQATLGHASVATIGRYLHARPTDSSARYLGV